MYLRDVSSTYLCFDVSFYFVGGRRPRRPVRTKTYRDVIIESVRRNCKMDNEKKKCGLYMRVSTDDQAKERI